MLLSDSYNFSEAHSRQLIVQSECAKSNSHISYNCQLLMRHVHSFPSSEKLTTLV